MRASMALLGTNGTNATSAAFMSHVHPYRPSAMSDQRSARSALRDPALNELQLFRRQRWQAERHAHDAADGLASLLGAPRKQVRDEQRRGVARADGTKDGAAAAI